MEIVIEITDLPFSPLQAAAPQFPLNPAHSGAVVEFYGVVRGSEQGAEIDALQYEALQPMAEHQCRRILTELAERHPCHRAEIWHRTGRVAAGEPSLRVRIYAAHRKEAFAMLTEFCDRLKQDVPIWKSV